MTTHVVTIILKNQSCKLEMEIYPTLYRYKIYMDSCHYIMHYVQCSALIYKPLDDVIMLFKAYPMVAEVQNSNGTLPLYVALANG
jgi:hypothetical protein